MDQSTVLTVDQKMALMKMQSQAKSTSVLDIFNDLKREGLSSEAITALKEISLKTAKDITGKTIEVGKIIILKIIDFVKANPNVAMGMAIGAAFGFLVSFIPFIGPFLAPFATFMGVSAGTYYGNKLQNRKDGNEVLQGPEGVLDNLIDLAKKFFSLLKEIFQAIFKPESLA